jgi:hypothetical protein
MGKKSKLRRYREEIEESISDLGLLAAKLEFTDQAEAEHAIFAKLPSAADYREFMALHASLHRLFLRFGTR